VLASLLVQLGAQLFLPALEFLLVRGLELLHLTEVGEFELLLELVEPLAQLNIALLSKPLLDDFHRFFDGQLVGLAAQHVADVLVRLFLQTRRELLFHTRLHALAQQLFLGEERGLSSLELAELLLQLS